MTKALSDEDLFWHFSWTAALARLRGFRTAWPRQLDAFTDGREPARPLCRERREPCMRARDAAMAVGAAIARTILVVLAVGGDVVTFHYLDQGVLPGPQSHHQRRHDRQ